MPDQPDDPVHYDMKVPPEPQNATLNKQREQQRGSDEVTAESNQIEREDGKSGSDLDSPADRSN